MVIVYLVAIVLANLSIVWLGKYASVVNAFLFIGLDFVARDRLHEQWAGKGIVWKMGLLIASGSVLSWILNRDAGIIAVASFVAFALAAIVDTIVYAIGLRRGWAWMKRSNTSNVASASADSVVFPWIAFGGFDLTITTLQFVAKVGGGLFWSFLSRHKLEDYDA